MHIVVVDIVDTSFHVGSALHTYIERGIGIDIDTLDDYLEKFSLDLFQWNFR